MDLGWVAIAVGDVAWLSLAFGLGFTARSLGLPPLVGFLVAGFILNTQSDVNTELFQKLSDIGITLLLFTVGLKINLKTLIKPQIWAVTGIHMLITVLFFSLLIYGLAFLAMSSQANMNLTSALVIAFALSFSSTVFVVKVLEDKGELKSLHGAIAIGILIMQDIAAVIFLALSTHKLPNIWALSLLLLIPLRHLFYFILRHVGRGELLILYGFLLAIGGAEIFELMGMKGDLGALIVGMLIASHSKADGLAKSMLGFKDLFLLGFFISIGLAGDISFEILIIAAIITLFLLFKTLLFFALLIGFKFRARTALLSSFNLANYSEFGLIVAAIAAKNNWIANEWLIIIAIAMSLSFIIAAILNHKVNHIFSMHKSYWRKFQRKVRLEDDHQFEVDNTNIMIIGMGTLGTGAYYKMKSIYENRVVGIDIDPVVVNKQQSLGINIIQGDPSDADFWDRMQQQHSIELVMLALPTFNTTLAVIEQLNDAQYHGKIAAITKYPEQAKRLQKAGIMTVANLYAEAGSGFASHVAKRISELNFVSK